jgi:DNA ligase-associated metallophosphoesterase
MKASTAKTCAGPGTEVVIAGERMLLTGARAIVWLARSALIVADLHIGKAAAFRARGLPVPHGTTGDTLERLSAAIERYGIARVYVLGDLLHARQSLPAATLAALRAWRDLYPALEVVLIRGNHDRNAGPPPRELRVDVYDEVSTGPFVLAHHPRPSERGYVLCGHLHPAIRISGRLDSLRLPCYWLRETVGVLPAFGAFTGAWEIKPGPGDRIYALADERVFELPRRDT